VHAVTTRARALLWPGSQYASVQWHASCRASTSPGTAVVDSLGRSRRIANTNELQSAPVVTNSIQPPLRGEAFTFAPFQSASSSRHSTCSLTSFLADTSIYFIAHAYDYWTVAKNVRICIGDSEMLIPLPVGAGGKIGNVTGAEPSMVYVKLGISVNC
jgi:hypothetical protein